MSVINSRGSSLPATSISMLNGMSVDKKENGYIELCLSNDEVFLDKEETEEMIRSLQLALKLGWCEPNVKEVK